MPLVLANRVQETTATTGTGTITLAGAVSGYQSFAAIGNGNTTYYTITSGTAWEVGIGTYSTTGPTLARTTILSSSAGGAAITLVGVSTVFVTYPSNRSVNYDEANNLTLNNTVSITGTLAAALGSAAAPSYTFTGDTNTGMWSPGADTIAFSEGGVEAMRIDSNGNVMVGTTSATGLFSVEGLSYGQMIATNRFGVIGNNLYYGTGNFRYIGNGHAYGWAQGNTDGADLRLLYAGNNTSGGGAIATTAERLYITAAGNVGIGTSSPATKLDVVSGAGTDNIIRSIAGNAAYVVLQGTSFFNFNAVQSYDSSSNLQWAVGGNGTANTLCFLTNGANERMRITSAGNVGVGTTAPLARLFAETPTSTGAAIAYAANSNGAYPTGVFGGSFGYNFSAGGAEVDFWNGWTGAAGTQGGFAFRRQTGASSQNLLMTIQGDGNVGIGTSAPVQRLHVRQDQDGTTAALIQNRNGSGTPISAVQFISGAFDLSDNRYAMISSAGGSNTRLQFWTGQGATPTEKMRITDAGNVGIGETSPGARLHVSGGTVGTTAGNLLNVTIDQGIAGTNGVGIRTNLVRVSSGTDWTTTAMRLQGRVDATNFGYIDLVTGGAQGMTFGSDASERMRIDATGNLLVGTTSATGRLTVQSAGSDVGYFDTTDTTGGPKVLAIRSIASSGTSTPALVIRQWRTSFAGSQNAGEIRFDGLTTTGNYAEFASIYAVSGANSASGAPTAITFQTMNASYVTGERMRIDSAGNVGIGTSSPDANAKLDVAGTVRTGAGGSDPGTGAAFYFVGSGSFQTVIGGAAFAVNTGANNARTERMRIDTSGNVGIGTSSPGYRLDIASGDTTAGLGYAMRVRSNATATAATIQFTPSTVSTQNGIITCTDTGAMTIQTDGASSVLAFRTNGSERLRILNTGGITSGDLADAVGYKGVPQNSQTASYTLALSDMGKHISITTGGVVIPANGSVAFPIGSTITVYNNSASAQNISITTDTLRLAGTATTGTRSLAQRGLATCIKVAATEWVVTGNVT